MRDDEGLRQAILAQPDEDAPRLVYADWLEDHGEADRAEFIRIQIELARMTLYDRRRPALTRREYELFARHGNAWSAPFIGRVRRWQYRRGFVEQVKLTVGQLLEAGEMLWSVAPLRDLDVDYPQPAEVKKLAASPWLRRVERIELNHSKLGDAGLRALIASPHLTALRELVLKWCDLTDVGLKALARSKNLPALESLDLDPNDDVEGDDLAAFVKACRLPRLCRLAFDRSEWSPTLFAALASSDLLPRLTAFELAYCDEEEPLRHLLAGRLDRMEELDLQHTNVTAGLLRTLVDNPSLRRLRKLNVGANAVGDEGAALVADAPLADTLEELILSDAEISDAGVARLARSPRLARLIVLDLSNNPVLDAGCRALAEAGALPGLQCLSLAGCGLSWRGTQALLGSPLVDRLGRLDLSQNPALGRRAIGTCLGRLGEALEHEVWEASHSAARVVAYAKKNPPRCLSGFVVHSDSPLIRRCHAGPLHGDSEWVAFELAHPDPAQRPTLLGYWHRYGQRPSDRMLVTPMAVRWDPSGQVVELFDAEQHGYAAENDFNCTVTYTGPRVEWRCPHPGCRDHALIACFLYPSDCPPDRPLDRYLAPQEQFRGFWLYAYCRGRDAFEHVTESECK